MPDPRWPAAYALALAALLAIVVVAVIALAQRRTIPRLLNLLLWAGLFAAASWPLLGGRLLFEYHCRRDAGLHLAGVLDAREGGYLLPYPQPTAGRFSYFTHAVVDLVQERIRFFEVETAPRRYSRYSLPGHHHADCVDPEVADTLLAGLPLPARRCLAMTTDATRQSRYELAGYRDGAAIPAEVLVRDRETAAPVASFRWLRRGRGFGFLPTDAVCPLDAARERWQPLWNLSAFVFRDRGGNVVTDTDLARYANRGGPPAAPQQTLIPPLDVVRRGITEEGLARAACELPPLPDDTRVFRLARHAGAARSDQQLDGGEQRPAFVVVDLNLPAQPLVLVAESDDPTIWHLHTGPGTQVTAMVVRGRHGQAVEGLGPWVRLLLSTRKHNPGANCTPKEIAAVLATLATRFASADAVPLEPGHLLIGEATLREGQEGFHGEQARAAFVVSR